MEACLAPGRGDGERLACWRRVREALMARFAPQGNQRERRKREDGLSLPAGFEFSVHEGEEDRAVTPSVLEALVERCLTDARRTGTVYTPRFLVRWMAREAISQWLDARLSGRRRTSATEEAALLEKIRVLDLSVGAGAFTMGMLHELVRRRRLLEPERSEAALVRAAVEENIYGVDINGIALEAARDRFHCALRAAGGDAPLTDHLFSGDSLDMSSSGVWNRELAPVMEEGGFDLVVGNPPFIGEKGNKELFDRLKASPLAPYCSLRMDYWYVFACVGLDALKPGGCLHLVVPNKWMANAGAVPLRRKLLEECSRLRLSDFGACRVFKAARVQTMALLAEKGNGGREQVTEYRRFNGEPEEAAVFLEHAPYRACRLPEDRVAAAEQGVFFCSSEEEGVLDRMEACRNVELDPVREIAQGIVPNPDVVSSRALERLDGGTAHSAGIRRGEGVFVVPRDFFNHVPEEERQFLKPLYEPSLVRRYVLKEPEKVLLYLTPGNGSERAVTLIRHLERFRPLLEARRETRLGRMKFYHVHWPRKEVFFRPGPKILAVRKCSRPTFAYTEKEAYVMMAFNVIRTERVSMKYLAALLNSRLMQFWFLRRGKMQGDFFQMDTAPILRVPIRVPGLSVLQEVEALADALAERYSPEGDERMNRMVEEVYGLSQQEREVVIQACFPQRAGWGSMPE